MGAERLGIYVRELSDEVEFYGAPDPGMLVLEERIKGLEDEARRREERMSQAIEFQSRKIENLEERVKTMADDAMMMGLVLYHLDIHHRREVHGLEPDPADGDILLDDQGYTKMQQSLRDHLESGSQGNAARQRFGLGMTMETRRILEHRLGALHR
jgi:hypothetical protein